MSGERQGQRSASLPRRLGRGKEGWRATVGGMGWAEEEKSVTSSEVCKKTRPCRDVVFRCSNPFRPRTFEDSFQY